ncbi:hypothetical protein QR680_000067 [Steinernema hermaphroditum]|uniref:HECT-type E3 ubiquitin transferase n=1 Tax=Steinernema hermaphroditum TaxID=289476 RepID=A0AA39LDM6_9BILA|nr:hypothetical protein QR680_000067 [Steinernema hermaphroditum]
MIALSATQQYLIWKSYSISPRKFKEVSVGARAENALAAIGKFSNDFKAAYPSKANGQNIWVPISAGGAQLSLSFAYTSLTEYVVLFHASAQTWGRSGLHWSNSSCTVLSGSVNRFVDTGLLPMKESFVAGGNFRHGQFESALYGFGQDTAVACYGRGVVPVSGFWVSSGYAANADVLNFAKLNYLYLKSTYEHFAYELAKLFDHYKSRATKGIMNLNAISFNGDIRGDKRNAAMLADLETHQRFVRWTTKDRTDRQDCVKRNAAAIKIQKAWNSFYCRKKVARDGRQLFDAEFHVVDLRLSVARLGLFFNCDSDGDRLVVLCKSCVKSETEVRAELRAAMFRMISRFLFYKDDSDKTRLLAQCGSLVRFVETYAKTADDAIILATKGFFDGICNVLIGHWHSSDGLPYKAQVFLDLLLLPLRLISNEHDEERINMLVALFSTLCRHNYHQLTIDHGFTFISRALERRALCHTEIGRALNIMSDRMSDHEENPKYINRSNAEFVVLFIIQIINRLGGDPSFCQKDALEALCNAFFHYKMKAVHQTEAVPADLAARTNKSSNSFYIHKSLVRKELFSAALSENFSSFIQNFALAKRDRNVMLRTVSWTTMLTMHLNQGPSYASPAVEASVFPERLSNWMITHIQSYLKLLQSYNIHSFFSAHRLMMQEYLSGSPLYDAPPKARQEFFAVATGYCAVVGKVFEMHDELPLDRREVTEWLTAIRDLLASTTKIAFTTTKIAGATADVEHDAVLRELFRASLTAARACYAQDCKLRFLPVGFWQNHGQSFYVNRALWDRGSRQRNGRQMTNFRLIDVLIGRNHSDPDDDDDEENEATDIPSDDVCIVTLLRQAPFLISFSHRVEMFHDLIREDRQNTEVSYGFGFHNVDLEVRRESLYTDAMKGFANMQNITKPLRVRMINYHGLSEAGIDGGGVFREFLSELLKIAFDPNQGLFLVTSNQLLYPNPAVDKLYSNWYEHYFFIGRVLGKMIYEEQLTEFRFASSIIHQLFSRETTTSASFMLMRDFDRHMYKTLTYLRDCPDHEVETLDLDFSVIEDKMDVRKIVDLVPGGHERKVKAHDRYLYIDLYLKYYLVDRFAPMVQALKAGMANVFDLDWLSLFSSYEQETLLSGIDVDFDVDELRSHCNVTNVKDEHDEWYMDRFWSMLKSFTVDDKNNFLKFVTGSPRAPLMGFKYLTPNLGIQLIHDETPLPTAATCMNLLKLPKYSSAEQMREKVLYAMHSGAGFELS